MSSQTLTQPTPQTPLVPLVAPDRHQPTLQHLPTVREAKALLALLRTADSLQKKRLIARELCRHYFKDEWDEPFVLTDGQADIFNCVFLKEYPRNEIIAPTQYGKSTTVAMAVLLRSVIYREEWAIVAPSQDKAQIIMAHVIKHIFDHPLFIEQLEYDPKMPLDRIKRERTKKHINWRNGGEVRTYSADARNQKARQSSLAGFGADNVIADESSLIPDDLQVMIDRMLGRAPSWHPSGLQGYLLKIGNPFQRNHFYKTWKSQQYVHVFIDYHQGIREGRYTPEFIAEMRTKPLFDILYGCIFPPEASIDDKGYRPLVPETLLNAAILEHSEAVAPRGKPRIGVDVAGGGANQTVITLRYNNVARVLERNHDPDLMANARKVVNYAKEYGVAAEDISIDDNGIGQGLSYRVIELMDDQINQINAQDKAKDRERFNMVKAEQYWAMRLWLVEDGGKLIRDDGWGEIEELKYKEDSSGKLKMETKEEQRARGIPSPDTAESLMLTFTEPTGERDADDMAII